MGQSMKATKEELKTQLNQVKATIASKEEAVRVYNETNNLTKDEFTFLKTRLTIDYIEKERLEKELSE